MSVIVWNGTDLLMAAIGAGAIVLGAVILLVGWFCQKLEDWGKKREEKEEDEE